VSPADKPLKTPAREPPNERKGAIGLSEAGIKLKYSPGVMKTEGAWGSFLRFGISQAIVLPALITYYGIDYLLWGRKVFSLWSAYRIQ